MDSLKITDRKNYFAWDILLSDFPEAGTIEEQIAFLLRFGILAPSTHNTQPWKFKVRKNTLSIYPDFSYALPGADPIGMNLFISLGCCITNILCATAYYNFSTELTIVGSGKRDTVVQIVFIRGNKKKDDLGLLCQYIPKRYSNKLDYLPQKINKKFIDKLQTVAVNNTIQTIITTDAHIIQNLAQLQKSAIEKLSSNNTFRKELSYWLRPNNTTRMDGMPGFVGGLKPLQTIIGIQLIPNLPIFMKILAKKDKKLVAGSPAIGIITGEDENIQTLINIGRTYELLALQAAAFGISMAPMHALVEDKKLSQDVKKLFHVEKNQIYMFFRLGITNNIPYHTPRRTLEYFLL